MAKTGQRSAASMEIADQIGNSPRLPAPVHMSDAERAVWAQAVGDQPGGSFTAVHEPLLELYCRHVVRSRVLADEIDGFQREWLADRDGLKRYDTLLAMAEREGRAASSLATRLRITRQATTDPKTVGRASRNMGRLSKPWELKAPD